jgi:hypothetical protein
MPKGTKSRGTTKANPYMKKKKKKGAKKRG